MKTNQTHKLKTWPEPFKATRTYAKRFEFRLNDRDFQVGDDLLLQEWEPEGSFGEVGHTDETALVVTGRYTGQECLRTVTYILRGPAFGIPEGYVVMSID